MARVRALFRGTQSVRPHPTLVDCYYQTLLDADGKVLLHLSTFGSQDRQSEPKSSQSIQIDETVAQELMVLLANSFPRLRGGVDHE